jgi:hypothetical protein
MKRLILAVWALLPATLLVAQGYYVEYKLSSNTAEGALSGAMKTYVQDGNTRMEMNMNTGMGAFNMVNLVLKSSPSTVYMLDEKSKTYTEIKTGDDEEWRDYAQEEYEVTVLGKEKVNGYNATHVKVKRKGSNQDIELWNTTEIAGYTDFAMMKTKYTGKYNMLKAMEAKGAAGFPVRIKAAQKQYAMQMDLVKAEKRTNPETLFTLNGYTKGGNSAMPAGIDMQEMMRKMENMTPEEREKWVKQMQEMYKPH